MTRAMADSMAEAREGTAGMTDGTAVIVADGTVVVPDGWIGMTAIDLIGGIITVIGGLTGDSGKLFHRKAVQQGGAYSPYCTAFHLTKFGWPIAVCQFRSIVLCEYSRRAR
jgi:hypothetical protein